MQIKKKDTIFFYWRIKNIKSFKDKDKKEGAGIIDNFIT